MVQNSVLISNSSFVGSSAGQAYAWQGGKTAFAISANTFGSAVYLQMQSPNGISWINVNSGVFSANQITNFDLPSGMYRLANNSSSSVNVYAILASVPY